ncbi:hypothetical protein [Flavobacterium sp.]|uniref:hypothetical protein n=1 Tax=Flavobacterium sp. TaxID=239 RepID=UPI003D13410D
MLKKITFSFILFSLSVFSQTKFAGIEFNTREIKVLVIETKSENAKEFKLKNFWTDPTYVIQNEDRLIMVRKITEGLIANFQKAKLEQNVEIDKIFIIGEVALFSESEMVAIQKDLLKNKISNIDFLDNKKSSKYLFDGLFANVNKEDVFLINSNENQTTFCGYNKKNEFVSGSLQNSSFSKIDFLLDATKITEYTNLNDNIKQLFYYHDNLKDKSAMYLSGEFAWASYTLINGGSIDKEFNPIELGDLEKHQNSLEKKFNRYEVLASANIEAEKVMSYYTKNELTVGNKLLMEILKNASVFKETVQYCKHAHRAKLANYLSCKIQ